MSITRSIFLSLSLALSTCLAAAPLPEVLSFLKGYDSRPGVRATILVRDLQTGETILSHRSDETFRPASLVKIATTGAFLSMRGGEIWQRPYNACSARRSDHSIGRRARGDRFRSCV